MLKTVCFISQQAMEHHVVPRADTAVISITAPGDDSALIKDGFYSVLRLQFDDLYEENIAEKAGNVPDADCDGGKVLWHNLVLPDIHHAREIITFVCGLQCEHLIVHCHAGVSRSAAVAKFVSERYQVPIDQANDDVSCANKRLLRLLNKLHLGHDIVLGKFVPKGDAPRSDSQYSNDKFGIFCF